jgi:hypothetical protein
MYLRCATSKKKSDGSQKALNCSFVPTLPGPPEFYSGVINKLGVDLGGTRGGIMVWAVYAPTTRAAGFLAGTYAGASAEVTVGGGIGAVALRVVHGQLSIRTLVAASAFVQN